MTRISAAHFRDLERRWFDRNPTHVPIRRRGVPSKWEQSYADECLPMSALFEPLRLVVGDDGKKRRYYTPDWLTVEFGRVVLHEVKGRRHREGMAKLHAAVKLYGHAFRFVLATGGPGRWEREVLS